MTTARAKRLRAAMRARVPARAKRAVEEAVSKSYRDASRRRANKLVTEGCLDEFLSTVDAVRAKSRRLR